MPFGKMTGFQTLPSASSFFPKGVPLNEGNGMSSLYKIQVSPCLVTCDHFPLVGFCIFFSSVFPSFEGGNECSQLPRTSGTPCKYR